MKAHKLAPHEDYILRHLHIVQTRINKLSIPREKLAEAEEFRREEETGEFAAEGGTHFLVQ